MDAAHHTLGSYDLGKLGCSEVSLHLNLIQIYTQQQSKLFVKVACLNVTSTARLQRTRSHRLYSSH